MAICYKCKNEEKTVKSFGKDICLSCLEKRKTGVKGHSGMIYNPDINPSNFCNLTKGIKLLKVKKSHPLFVKWYIEHYPKSKGIVGRQLNYLIYFEGKPVGIISAVSPPLNYKLFREYFAVKDDLQFVNNGVFRVVKSPKKNFASQVLKVFRNQIKKDYTLAYGDELKGIITFVEKPRNGGIYLADNWKLLGETQGVEVRRRGQDWINKSYTKTGNKKLIFVFKYKSAGVKTKSLRDFPTENIICIKRVSAETSNLLTQTSLNANIKEEKK